MLIGETDSAELEALLADTNKEVVETILSETNSEPESMSARKAVLAERTSVSKTESAATPTGTPARVRSRKGSDRKAARAEVPQRQPRRQSGPMRQRILTLRAAHPEGLSAEDLRVSLNADQRMGETLQDMRQAGSVKTRGRGKALRYVVASPSQEGADAC
jgi:hypothetical protein